MRHEAVITGVEIKFGFLFSVSGDFSRLLHFIKKCRVFQVFFGIYLAKHSSKIDLFCMWIFFDAFDLQLDKYLLIAYPQVKFPFLRSV